MTWHLPKKKQTNRQNKKTMDYRELMSHAPADCAPKVVNLKDDLQQSREKLAKELGKSVEELTEDEEETALRRIGLCSLDLD